MDRERAKRPAKMFDFSDPKTPPILTDHSPPAPSIASSSCVPNVANVNDDNEKKNRSQEEVLSPGLQLTLSLFPTSTCTNIQESSSSSVGHNNGGNQSREIALAMLQGNKPKSVPSSTFGKTRIISAETKRSTCSIVPKKNKRAFPRHEEEEQRYAGISTELVLYEDPWKIKKKLTPSDLGHLSRLLLPMDCVTIHVLQWMPEEMVSRVKSREGMSVTTRDVDTGDEHRLVFRYWVSSNSYLLNGEWNKQFVKRRGLEKDDEIGMLWDPIACIFWFTVLRKRQTCGTSNTAA